ncbi:MAG: hypothetical protein ACKPIC_30060, partial [Microcystis panniformis]
VGKWGSGEIELKPQHPNTPTPQHLKPVSLLRSPFSLLLKYKVSVTKLTSEQFSPHHRNRSP